MKKLVFPENYFALKEDIRRQKLNLINTKARIKRHADRGTDPEKDKQIYLNCEAEIWKL